MRYFTIEEAESLIPELEKIYAAISEIRPKAEAKMTMIRTLEGTGDADPSQLAIEKAQLEFLVNGINEWLQKILDLGAMPKGLDPTLVDFPFRLKGREVYLCWQLGEKSITQYHGIEEGFSGRKKLPR